jgi:5-methylcytosine-specific restriction endonuclease McrA
MIFPKDIDPTNIDKDYWTKENAAQVDHVYPKSKGGKAELWNAQVLCRSCNIQKGDSVTTSAYVNYHSKNTAQGISAMVDACLQCTIL